MHQILNKIKEVMERNMELYLPHVKDCDLENGGAIYYMN